MDGGKTIRQLKKEAMQLKIKGYYNMRKVELGEAISRRKTELAKMIRDIDNMRIGQLRSFAKKVGLKMSRRATKTDLVEAISKMFSSWKKENERKIPGQITSSFSMPSNENKETKSKIELPKTYKKDKLVGLEVNPSWIHFYWDFSEKTKEILKAHSSLVLRVYDVTYIEFNGTNAHRTFEMEMGISTQKYYVQVPQPNADYIAEIGYKERNKFVPLLRSNLVTTPPSSPKLAQMELWMDLRTYQRFSEMSSGKAVTRIERLVGISSIPSSPSKISGRGSFFWLSGRS